MKNFFRIIISTAAIFAFSSSLIFCCAFQAAQASVAGRCNHAQSGHDGHSQSDKADHQQDSHSSHDCMCQQTFVADFGKSFNPDLASAHFFKKFFKNDAMPGRPFDPSSSGHPSLSSERSPPLIAAVSISVYLKNSNLRL